MSEKGAHMEFPCPYCDSQIVMDMSFLGFSVSKFLSASSKLAKPKKEVKKMAEPEKKPEEENPEPKKEYE